MWSLIEGVAARLLFLFRLAYIYYLCPFFIIFVKLWTSDKPQDWWEAQGIWLCGIKLVAHPESVPIASGVMIASNHRNISDYFVHHCICKHTTNTLSRAGVAAAFPTAAVITTTLGTVWYFRRGNTKNHMEK